MRQPLNLALQPDSVGIDGGGLPNKNLRRQILPVSKSVQKQVRVAERRRLRNKPIRGLTKTNLTKAEKLIFSGELEAAQKAVLVAISSLDKAAEKGVIHPNNAARHKSRLMKKLNDALALSSAAKTG
jgi:small subunit ribosomal protein S20